MFQRLAYTVPSSEGFSPVIFESVRSKAKWRWVTSRISANKTSRSVALRLRAGQVHILSGRESRSG